MAINQPSRPGKKGRVTEEFLSAMLLCPRIKDRATEYFLFTLLLCLKYRKILSFRYCFIKKFGVVL